MKTWIKEHRYCYAVGYMIFYLAAFFLSEQVLEPKYIISCPLDDLIPFDEIFIIPYCAWYPLLAASWLFTMLTSKEEFQDLCMIMFGGMTLSIVLYWIFPNGLQLRPAEIPDNLCGKLVRLLHAVDTPGNVCPSIHVSSSTAILIVSLRSKVLKRRQVLKWGTCFVCVLICLSTMFIKQHSAVDFFAAIPVCLLAEGFVYRDRYFRKK